MCAVSGRSCPCRLSDDFVLFASSCTADREHPWGRRNFGMQSACTYHVIGPRYRIRTFLGRAFSDPKFVGLGRFGSAVFTPHDFRIRSLLASKFRVRIFLGYCWPQGGFGWLLAAGGFGSSLFLATTIFGSENCRETSFGSECRLFCEFQIRTCYGPEVLDSTPVFQTIFGSEISCPEIRFRKLLSQEVSDPTNVGAA